MVNAPPRQDYLAVFNDGSKSITSSWSNETVEAEQYGMMHAAAIGNGRTVVALFELVTHQPGALSVRQIFPVRSQEFTSLK